MDLWKVSEALRQGSREQAGEKLFSEGKSRWRDIRANAFYKPYLEEVEAEASRLLNEPIETLPYSLYKNFDETGSRLPYEREYFKRRLRLNTFTVMALTNDDPRYIEALEDIIWAICDEYTWSLPAHLQGNSLRPIEKLRHERADFGTIAESPREHREMVDLFAAETGFALAETVHLLGDKLSELIAYRARIEIRQRVLEPYASLGSMFWWETCTNNWAAVCAGSVGAAAMYLISDDATLAPMIARLLETMQCYLRGFEADGACTEGIGYWVYGFGYFTFFASLLEQRTAGAINLFDDPKVRSIALFQQKCYLTANYTVSFSDASLQNMFPLGLTHFLKGKYSEVAVPDLSYRASFTYDHCYRFPQAIRSFVWSDPQYASMPQQDASYYLEDAEWMISRTSAPYGAVSFAAKGGHNDEPHNHNDIGTFLLHVEGETLLTDTGAGEYTKQYFGPGRYEILCNRSLGHSVPVIEGGEQQAGRQYAAAVRESRISTSEDVFSLDIAKAYANDNLQSLIRTFRFAKTEGGKLTLTDEFQFAAKPAGLAERFVSFCRPEQTGADSIRIAGERFAVTIQYDPAKFRYEAQRTDFMDHHGHRKDLYLLDFTAVSPTEKETYSFVMTCSPL
ncbi:heparinase II/III domain-containing protein [Paenibacillus thalictri]|uniref:Heparinase II/III-like C-terminal domain-containing protein n=1 Tax=Paenibacillus thalictri TaxID=2527873 RepID=A0A4Q9DX08_9BACL|nr:heparinase II/III family protein [Paenibacillus thalictri]TBL81637.1 hypothetical protein EYB31_01145 [Paenibacillus thalictri]